MSQKIFKIKFIQVGEVYEIYAKNVYQSDFYGFIEIEGYIFNSKNNIVIDLKYFDGEPVIKELKRISTPGRRVYTDVKNLPKVRQGLGIAIISTSKGVMSDSKARATNVGGEILCTVF